jgi:hypothetical protein
MDKLAAEPSVATAFVAFGVGVFKVHAPPMRPTVKLATCGPKEMASTRFVFTS